MKYSCFNDSVCHTRFLTNCRQSFNRILLLNICSRIVFYLLHRFRTCDSDRIRSGFFLLPIRIHLESIEAFLACSSRGKAVSRDPQLWPSGHEAGGWILAAERLRRHFPAPKANKTRSNWGFWPFSAWYPHLKSKDWKWEIGGIFIFFSIRLFVCWSALSIDFRRVTLIWYVDITKGA